MPERPSDRALKGRHRHKRGSPLSKPRTGRKLTLPQRRMLTNIINKAPLGRDATPCRESKVLLGKTLAALLWHGLAEYVLGTGEAVVTAKGHEAMAKGWYHPAPVAG